MTKNGKYASKKNENDCRMKTNGSLYLLMEERNEKDKRKEMKMTEGKGNW